MKRNLTQADYTLIQELQTLCTQHEPIALKLELDYKLEDAMNSPAKAEIGDINEFLCFAGNQLIGYIGICGFGGSSAALEITGMVHPDYRRQGIFTRLHQLVMAECRRRNASNTLVLCDRKSVSGQKFLEKIGAVYQNSEYEMYQRSDFTANNELQQGIVFRKATNADAQEVARQNEIFFHDLGEQTEDGKEVRLLLPEEEEKRGMTVYMAEKDGQCVGKVHLQLLGGVGGIYGLGVLPEYRGKGYGRAILLKSVEQLRQAQATEVMLQVAVENATALGLYLSCGFEETSVMDYSLINATE